MPTRSSGLRLSFVLSLCAAALSLGVGGWLLARPETSLRVAGIAALASAALAVASALLRRPDPVVAPVASPAPAVAPTPALDPVAIADGGALRLLAKFQESGRLIDFAFEDIGAASDAQIAAVARVVHTGCRATLHNAFSLEPLHAAAEGSTVTLDPGFDPEAHRLLGRVVGTPPFTGTLLHRGWRSTAVKLPHASDPTRPPSGIVAPAEIELR